MRVLLLPLVFTLAFLGMSFLPRIHGNPHLLWSFRGFGFALLVWLSILHVTARRKRRRLRARFVLQKNHYVQVPLQLSIYIYWGMYWPEVANHAWLIVAQIVFAYALDMILCWSRRDEWRLGFHQIPILLSTNLFIWFRDDWFYWQFLMVAIGVLGKEFLRWTKDGKRAHVFNPSALSLFIASIVLILAGKTDITWGPDIATTLLNPPHIYELIFLAGLVVQVIFFVTPVTLSAAAALFALSFLYKGIYGIYFFGDSTIPIAVFLGLHLLVTDPVSSPRTHGGRLLFGALYGIGVFVIFHVFSVIGVPTFYDKLLPVPVLNLAIKMIDALIASDFWKSVKTRISFLALRPLPMNFVLMGVWIALFAGTMFSGDVGGVHEGRKVSFWREACEEGLAGGCENLVQILKVRCEDGSGAACHERGVLQRDGKVIPQDLFSAVALFQKSCKRNYLEGCDAVDRMDQWNAEHVDELRDACEAGNASVCAYLAFMYHGGLGVPRDRNEAVRLFHKACDMGYAISCDYLEKSLGISIE